MQMHQTVRTASWLPDSDLKLLLIKRKTTEPQHGSTFETSGNVKLSVLKITGISAIILGCCLLTFALVLACLVWGDNQPGGEFYISFPTLDRELRITMAISAGIGFGAIALGFYT